MILYFLVIGSNQNSIYFVRVIHIVVWKMNILVCNFQLFDSKLLKNRLSSYLAFYRQYLILYFFFFCLIAAIKPFDLFPVVVLLPLILRE